ncbi:MAG: InlB B-repeat-containing protein [Lachnospiraceae bacterium]|nr:InlB B-repeat-containing protein [Lachnospiraceae bacterium]
MKIRKKAMLSYLLAGVMLISRCPFPVNAAEHEAVREISPEESAEGEAEASEADAVTENPGELSEAGTENGTETEEASIEESETQETAEEAAEEEAAETEEMLTDLQEAETQEPADDTTDGYDLESLEESWTLATGETMYDGAVYSSRNTGITEIKSDGTAPYVPESCTSTQTCMEISGYFYTKSAETILERLNEIRLEACKEGVINPNTGEALTEDDYVPLEWSADLEAIARLRAAEADVLASHTRPDGTSCFTARTNNGVGSNAENLAWNYSGLMRGIEQFYAEKADWVAQNSNAVTGHYTNIINPSLTYVAMGAFRLSDSGSYAVAYEATGSYSGLDTSKDSSSGKQTLTTRVTNSSITKLSITPSELYIEEGALYKLPVTLTAEYDKSFSGSLAEGKIFTSADENVAVVYDTGTVLAYGVGTTTVTALANGHTDSVTINVVEKGSSGLTVTLPDRTTYKVGESIDLTGGKVSLNSGSSVSMTSSMISGFSSATAGICTVSVLYEGCVSSFDVLIVAEPVVSGTYGQTLSDIALPENEYGIYTWQNGSTKPDTVGSVAYPAIFTPYDTAGYQTLSDIEATVNVYASLTENKSAVSVSFRGGTMVYDGTKKEPAVVLTFNKNTLTENEDYTVLYYDNINAGTASALITGCGYYEDCFYESFEISPAELLIYAEDVYVKVGAQIPSSYAYGTDGLFGDDKLVTEPILTCDIVSTEAAGAYDIVPSGADAGSNYTITYENGTLLVAEEAVVYTVTFDVQGHGTAPTGYAGVIAGSNVEEPAEPEAEGYLFNGWYREPSCVNKWDFKSDIVQSDITLYAKWLISSGDFSVQEIGDMTYTGKALKPQVSVYDGTTALRLNKDYTVAYVNNVNANAGGVLKSGSGAGKAFNSALPYVIIKGKGNYTGTVDVNFNILPVDLEDCTLKYSDQLSINTKKAVSPFKSIKGVKSMKQGTDFELTLLSRDAYDGDGNSIAAGVSMDNAMVPAGYSGSFTLRLDGAGNYEGTIEKEVYVADAGHLIKNVKIVLGNNIKSVDYTGRRITLNPSDTASDDAFIVKMGNTVLSYGDDYEVSYKNNASVGKAQLVITGIGDYAGTKSQTFTIKGRTFSAKTVTVDGISDRDYTGKALTQNNVSLIYGAGTDGETALVYGTDYTISYTGNVSSGKASMTFTGVASKGYSGSFRKTFKINAADISDESMVVQDASTGSITVPFEKGGVQPSERVLLTNASGKALTEGTDYTLKFRNNKAVAASSYEKAPEIVVKGKGNYKGTLSIPFTITQGSLENVTVSVLPTAYNEAKDASYEYKPAVKVTEGKAKLSPGKDYEVTYVNNTQSDYLEYLAKYEAGTATKEDMPRVVITAADGSSYSADTGITAELPIYKDKLNKKELQAVISSVSYSGSGITPEVTVSYGGAVLIEGKDYTLSYGANVTAGKNKGTVTVSGVSPLYGGSVTYKFDIAGRDINI